MAEVKTLTKDIGIEIRDTLRNNADVKELMQQTDLTNYVYYKRPASQSEGFENPRIVVEPIPDAIAGRASDNLDGQYTGAIQYQITFWINDGSDDAWLTTDSDDLLDTIKNAMNGTSYAVTDNFGHITVNSYSQAPDADKEFTTQGVMVVTFNLGGI